MFRGRQATNFWGAAGHQILADVAETPLFGTMGVTRPSSAVIIFAVTRHFSPPLTTLTNDFFQCPAQTHISQAGNQLAAATRMTKNTLQKSQPLNSEIDLIFAPVSQCQKFKLNSKH